MKKLIALIVISGAIVAAAVFVTIQWQSQVASNALISSRLTSIQTAVHQNAKLSSAPAKAPVVPKRLAVTYNDYGFEPNESTVPVGTTVTIKNATNEGGMVFEQISGPTPFAGMVNLGDIAMGKSASFTLNRPGTYVFQNAWETTDKMQVTVQ